MPTFTPPVINRVPPVETTTTGVARRFYSRFAPAPQGVNVWIMRDGTVLIDQQPVRLSNPDPDRTDWAAEAPAATFYGGHTYAVTTDEATLLTAAGLGEYLEA